MISRIYRFKILIEILYSYILSYKLKGFSSRFDRSLLCFYLFAAIIPMIEEIARKIGASIPTSV